MLAVQLNCNIFNLTVLSYIKTHEMVTYLTREDHNRVFAKKNISLVIGSTALFYQQPAICLAEVSCQAIYCQYCH